MADQTAEHKLGKAVGNALDSISFQPWAFGAVVGQLDSRIQRKVFLLFIAVLKAFKARHDYGLSNNPIHIQLGEYSDALLAEYEKKGEIRE